MDCYSLLPFISDIVSLHNFFQLSHYLREKQAAANTIAELQSRLSDLELSKTHSEVSDAIQKERTEMLLSLRKIMEAMKAEAASGGAASSKELAQLKAENEELKKVNAKQKYRIEHLVHNLRDTIDSPK